MIKPILSQTVFCLIFTLSLEGSVTVDQVIDRARARLGSESTLNAVQSIQYEGLIQDADGETISTLTLRFKRPGMQRLDRTHGTVTDITAVNGFEGYSLRLDSDEDKPRGILVLQPNQVDNLVCMAHENLYFFKGPRQRRGGQVELLGEEVFMDKPCHKVKFSYPGGLHLYRYFDISTGDLVATVNGENGNVLVERSTKVVDGIRLPHLVETYDDGELVRKVVFDRIVINAPMEDSLFDFPMGPISKMKAP